MKNIFKPLMIAILLAGTVFTGCDADPNASIIDDPNKETPVDPTNPDTAKVLVIDSANKNVKLDLVSEPLDVEKVTVRFTNGEKNLRRVYISKNVYGSESGVVVYDLSELIKDGLDTKADGSIDVAGKYKKGVGYKIPFQTPETKEGIVVYKIWATNGKGDIRNIGKRNVFGDETKSFGTITIKASKNANAVVNPIKKFSAMMLAAPLADGTSATFLSVYNGLKYKIKDGVESAALWDFGYYYGGTGKASLASANSYPKAVIDIVGKSGVSKADLNNFFIAKSTMNFDSADDAKIKAIATPTTQKVTQLTVGQVLEFQDAYGAKGLIKITEIKGKMGVKDYIKFDIKMQNFDYIKM